MKLDFKQLAISAAVSLVVSAIVVYASNNVNAVEDVIG